MTESQPTPPHPRLRDRPTGDLLVMAVGLTVCSVVIVTYMIIVLLAVIHPKADTSNAASQVGDIVNTLVGLLAGFLAGRTTNSMISGSGKSSDGDGEQSP